MIHAVAAALRGLLLRIDSKFSLYRRNLLWRSGQSHKARTEGGKISLQDFSFVAFRIDGNEDRHDPVLCAPELVHGGVDDRKRRRANIRAGGVSEIDQLIFSTEVAAGACSPVLVGQRVGPAQRYWPSHALVPPLRQALALVPQQCTCDGSGQQQGENYRLFGLEPRGHWHNIRVCRVIAKPKDLFAFWTPSRKSRYAV